MKFEPQCKTRADLHREMARVLDMCEAAGFDRPWECVMFDGETEDCFRDFSAPPGLYEFAIAIVERKPVFRYYNPPQRTIEINGVKVLAPHFVGHSFEFVKERFTVNVEYKSQADAEAFKAAMERK